MRNWVGFLEELRNWGESVRSKCSVEGVRNQLGLGRWVVDSQAVFVPEGNDLVFQALILLNMTTCQQILSNVCKHKA